MSNKELLNLVDALITKTKAKDAVWDSGSRTGQFKLSLESGAVTISKSTDGWTEIFYFEIYNINGEQIYETTGGADTKNPEKAVLHTPLGNLHKSAKHSYFKVEETFDGILNEVLNKTKIGYVKEKDDLPF